MYPHNIHFSVYPHNIHFTVCTHTTSTYSPPTVFGGRTRAPRQSGLMMHTHFTLRGWTTYPQSQGWCTPTLPWEGGPHTQTTRADVLMYTHFTIRGWMTHPDKDDVLMESHPCYPERVNPTPRQCRADVLIHPPPPPCFTHTTGTHSTERVDQRPQTIKVDVLMDLHNHFTHVTPMHRLDRWTRAPT